MAKYVGYKRPKDTKKTVKHLLTYLGHYKWAFLLIAILVFISAGAGIMGTFLIKYYLHNDKVILFHQLLLNYQIHVLNPDLPVLNFAILESRILFCICNLECQLAGGLR